LRGPRKSCQWKGISELHKLMIDIQTAHAKLSKSRRKQPRTWIKVPNDYRVKIRQLLIENSLLSEPRITTGLVLLN